jgi:hypothetical protein
VRKRRQRVSRTIASAAPQLAPGAYFLAFELLLTHLFELVALNGTSFWAPHFMQLWW